MGVSVTKDKTVYIYYFAGQSNCGGSDLVTNLTGEYTKYKTFSGVRVWFNKDYTLSTGNVESLKAGLNSRPGQDLPLYCGFENSMLWNLSRYKNRNICLVKLGIGGTGLDPSYNPDWHPDTNTSLYDGLVLNMKNTCQTYYEGLGYTVIHKAVVWVHGEQDSGSTTPTANYEANQTALFNAFRAEIQAAIPIIDIKLSTQIDGATYVNWAAINTAKDNVATALTNVYQMDFSDLQLKVDGVHYEANSYAIGGERIFELIKDL